MQHDDIQPAGGGTILLVDDEDMVLEVGARLLEKLHYAVLKAENGRDAVALFARHPDQVVLVILDMNMPGMSGGVVFEELRKLKPDVKVLLTSGYGLDGQTRGVARLRRLRLHPETLFHRRPHPEVHRNSAEIGRPAPDVMPLTNRPRPPLPTGFRLQLARSIGTKTMLM